MLVKTQKNTMAPSRGSYSRTIVITYDKISKNMYDRQLSLLRTGYTSVD